MSTYKLASSVSTLGILLIVTLMIIAQSTFVGYRGEEYSPFMHFISELGNPNKNSAYYLLNYGFMVVSLLFIPMTYLLGKYTECKLGNIAAITGIIAMLCIFSVGCLPEHINKPHLIAAVCFFTISAVLTAMFSIMSLKNRKLKKSFFIPSILPVIVYLIFLLYPKTEFLNISADPTNYERPKIVWLAVFEWLYFITLSIWVLSASHFLWKAEK